MPENDLHPLTPEGVSARLQALYGLNDLQLASEAEGVRMDLRLWLSQNFALTASEENYLGSMSNYTIGYLADQVAFCFVHRLAITFAKPQPPANPGLGKWVNSTSSISTSSNIHGGLIVSGGFQIKIIY